MPKFQKAKVVMCRNGSERKIRPSKSARNELGIQRIKVGAMRKYIVNPVLFKIPSELLERRATLYGQLKSLL